MRQSQLAVVALLVIVIAIVGVYAGTFTSTASSSCSTPGGSIQVVAGENFWGSLVSQLGGDRVHVLSIVTDPNADPHEYESNAADAQAVANACLVIVNGAGYDTWALKLIAASSSPHQLVLNVQELLGQPLGTNPHFWYSPTYVNETIRAMFDDLVSIDPGGSVYYMQQYAALNRSLAPLDSRLRAIAAQFPGTKVGATEDIFAYLANATKLDLISPPEFMEAVAEGNDPSAASVQEFQAQIQNKSISVLVYNAQTVTPLTTSIRSLAAQEDIPVVPVTETIQPPDTSFQDWMYGQLNALQNALNANALGQ